MFLYAMLDKKAGVYGPVMMAHNDVHMTRVLQETFRGSSHTVEKFPEDFDLYQVASYDGESGEVDRSLRFVANVGVLLNPNGSVANA